MIGASKILTVSYGTFSCTLEGFDEPFNTMKAIAEYFRDLAAEDRYFGAEPPTPDAAMLHRIAEREIQRRVEAKINEHGVVLRAGDPEAAPLAPPVLAPSVAAAPAIDANGETVAARLSRLRQEQTAATLAAPPVHEPTIHHIAEAAADAEDYSEDQHAEDILANISSIAAADRAEAADLGATALDELIAAEVTAPTLDAVATPEAESAMAEVIDIVDHADQPMAESDDLALLDALAEQDANDLADLHAMDAAVDVAEDDHNLAREDDELDDLAAADYASADFSDDFSDDADATTDNADQDDDFAILNAVADQTADTAAAPSVEVDSADADILADLLPEDLSAAEADDLPEAAAAVSDEDMLASVGALIAGNDQAAAAAPVLAQATPMDDYEDDYNDLVAADPGFEDDDLDDAVAEEPAPTQVAEVAEIEAAAPEPTLPEAQAELVDEPEPEIAPEPVAMEKLQRARARVIKIRRADAPAAASAPAATLAPANAAGTSLLSPEAEAALQAELAALEADDAPDAPRPTRPMRPTRPVRNLAPAPEASPEDLEEDARLAAALSADLPAAKADPAIEDDLAIETDMAVKDDVAVEAAAEPAPTHHAEGRRMLEAEAEDDAVNRLIAQTNSEMDGEENRRRHAAITHLKAAVAATEAERQIKAANPGRAPTDRQDAYRNDLDSVVRTKAPEPRAANADRPAPLVLVSEQRIIRPAAPAAAAAPVQPGGAPRVVMPVRPRRIAGGAATLSAVQNEDSLLGNAEDDYDEDEIVADEDLNLFAEGQSFEEFAERLGANSLSDLLEASAVYCAQVLGRPQFSRPLVMRQLEALPNAPEHSREDSMRVFGTLLRQGRIAKIKRGQFAVTDRSPLLAEALRNAG